MNINELLTPAEIAANWTEVASNRIPYFGAGPFPSRKKAGLGLSFFKGSKGLPVSLMPSTFDAQATFRDRVGFEKLETEMPFFRDGFRIGEKERQSLLSISESKDPNAAEIISRIYDDANELIDGAEVVAERMRMQLLFPENGNLGISIKANNVDYTYNYDPDGSWKANNYFALSGTSLWSAKATADPIRDIETVQDAVTGRTGTELKIAVMNKYTFNLLRTIDNVKNMYNTLNGVNRPRLLDNEIITLFSETNNIQFVVYDKMFKTESGSTAGSKVSTKFVPNGYVALTPQGALGYTWYGTSPEEADGRFAPMSVAIVNTGVAISRIITPHPVNVHILASEIVLPSYERADEVALLKVL